MDNYGIAPEPIARIQIRNLVRDTAALAETSCILSQTGATAQAVKCSREAISRISKVKEAEERIRIRVVCGIALADAGMIEGALEVDRARQKERAILNVRNQFAAALVQEYASSHGLTSEDKKFVTQIFDELRSEQFEEYRAPIIRAIALARAKAGKFNAALATVKTIKSPRWQVTVRAELAAALSAGGHLAQAKFVVEELVRTNSEPHALSEAAAILGNGGMTNAANLVASKVIGDSFKRRFDSESRALSEFSGDLSALRNVGISPETAKTVLDRYGVSDRVFMPLNPKASARDLAACALALSWVGERASAQRAISMAQDAVRSNGDAAEKSAVYSSAAQALARLGLFRAARRAAEQSSAASDRLNAFAAIVRERARAEAAPRPATYREFSVISSSPLV